MGRHLFISYAHAHPDEGVAFFLTDLLRAAGVDVWIDRVGLTQQSGAGLNEEIAAAISTARAVAVVASGYALASPYVQAEIVHALSLGIPVLKVEIEACAVPGTLLPLNSCPRVALAGVRQADWATPLLQAMAEIGISVSPPPHVDPLLTSTARIVRPNYRRLKAMDTAEWRALIDRLTQARALSPANGYNALSLALLRLVLRDVDGARSEANEAVRQLPSEPEAYYVRALTAAASKPTQDLFDNEAETILQDLARARRLPNYGAHVDALAALVIQGHYLANSKTPPAPPEQLIEMAQAPARVRAHEEIERLLDTVSAGSPDLRARIAALV